MSTLIVTLSSDSADAAVLYDYQLSPDGHTLGEQSRAPLALLPQVGNTGEVLLLVPANRLSWHKVQLPRGSLSRRFLRDGGPARLRAVLEGLLEDLLLDDTAQLHFALAPNPDPDAPVWVAVCDSHWLQAALQAFEQAGRAVTRVVPEFAPDSLSEVLHVIGEPEQASMVFNSQGTVAVWPLTRAAVERLNWPESQPILAEPAVAGLAEQLFKRSVALQQAGQRRLQAIGSSWDLAQFGLANSSGARTRKRLSASLGSLLRAPRWRAARFALLALLLVNLAGLNAWAWREQSRLKAQRAAIGEVLTSTFPQVRMVVDPLVQMSKEVAILQQASGTATARDMEVMLGAFGALAALKTVPTAIDFAAGELRLKGLKLSPDEVAAISFRLKPQSFTASAEGDSVVVRQVAAP